MPYGQGQMLGAGVDPRMFVQDYSGFTRAAEIQAQGMQNLGAMIGQGIKDFGEARQERKKIDAEIKATSAGIESAIKMGKDLGIDIGSYLSPIQAKINDPNTSPAEALALGRTAAQGISNAFTLGIGAQDREIRRNQEIANAIYKEQKLGMEERRTRATEFSAMQGAKPKFDLKEATITSPDGKTFKKDIPYDKEKGMFFDPDAGKYIQDINKWGFGEPAYAEDMPPTSQVGGSINESALPVPLRKYASSFEEQGSKYGVDPALLAAISMHETANGKSSAFRNKNNAMGVSNASGPIQMASVEASIEKMASLLGKGIHQGKGPYANAKSIEDIAKRYAPIGAGNDPRGLNKYWTNGVSSNYEKLSSGGQSDNSTSMIGDMSQQAMGTPEQKAEVARMIEQGAGMRTAQVAPSGAMPTEPRMAQPQPAAQQAPQYQVRPGFVPVGPKGGQKEAKIITGEEAKALNLDPLGTYEASYQDGQLTGVQTIKAAPSVGDIIAMEKRAEEKVAKQELNEAVKAKSERMISLMTELRNHPGFGGLFGVGYTGIPGTESANAKVLYDQIQAQGFMEAIKDMKGMGALSNSEGEKASAAFVGINPSMSEAAALARIDEVVKYIKEGEKRIQTGKLIETKENKGPSISGANSYFNQYKPPAR
jgi:hypothetical protein